MVTDIVGFKHKKVNSSGVKCEHHLYQYNQTHSLASAKVIINKTINFMISGWSIDSYNRKEFRRNEADYFSYYKISKNRADNLFIFSYF